MRRAETEPAGWPSRLRASRRYQSGSTHMRSGFWREEAEEDVDFYAVGEIYVF